MELSEDRFNRLSIGIIEKLKCSPIEAIQKLESLSIYLVCGEKIKTSLPLQAALITAVNTGKRAFLGGVYILMPDNTPCLLSWPEAKTFNEIILETGGVLTDNLPSDCFKIMFGLPVNDDNSIQIVCNSWQGGILAEYEALPFDEIGNLPTAGIFSGGLAICQSFLKLAGISIACCDKTVGISLWRPDLHWLSEDAGGPQITFLPKKIWLLGLGHLGQAYLWNIGLLPYRETKEISILLQDYDRIVEANVSAGLLCDKNDTGKYKTRQCSTWLEARGFTTVITERRFDQYTRKVDEDPFVALCGFDSASSRLHLENVGFDLIVESALGGNLATFDNIILHSFPGATKSPKDIWGDVDGARQEINHSVHEVLKKHDSDICGIVPLSIAGKAISASFVGACSGAFVIAELLRGLNGGIRFEKIVAHLRDAGDLKAIQHIKGGYTTELSRNGFVSIES
ncbi:hypothetical protein [Flavihumibacter sp. ZG627]|uniref:hypothetical protein n=1 Tax=Flavihumibacter sp. ZG627 TaxID=1463156 RepID=UPI00057EB632|nr:hypothetical protein [Flavihumibacter sp. ZG627]KIC89904.1 hypothetical protein HY58_14725 [Flavihumibacter sp. ZG627]